MNVLENKTNFTIEELIGIAQRENNTKRNYLLVNYMQAKHIPVDPQKALYLFEKLGEEFYELYKGKKVTFIGFAETATAIGASIACNFPEEAYYLHTTRENIDSINRVVDFQEEHSHATQQELFCCDAQQMLFMSEKIVFIEDEITTGKTILNFVEKLEQKGICGKKKFAAVSLINSMNQESFQIFQQKGIELHYLVKLENNFKKLTFKTQPEAEQVKKEKTTIADFELKNFFGRVEPRVGVKTNIYKKACETLGQDILKFYQLKNKKDKKVLILGTEEFMYPAIVTAKKLKEAFQDCDIKVHSTTRSPIVSSLEENYPIKNKSSFQSIYEKERKTYIYNLEAYDFVIIMTDATNFNEVGMQELISALQIYENHDILVVRWVE